MGFVIFGIHHFHVKCIVVLYIATSWFVIGNTVVFDIVMFLCNFGKLSTFQSLNAFLQRYAIVMKFVDKFEDCCTSFDSFQRLRAHSSYQTFMAKWSLPVYFQIR